MVGRAEGTTCIYMYSLITRSINSQDSANERTYVPLWWMVSQKVHSLQVHFLLRVPPGQIVPPLESTNKINKSKSKCN